MYKSDHSPESQNPIFYKTVLRFTVPSHFTHATQNFEEEDDDDDLFFEGGSSTPTSTESYDSTRRTRPTTPQRPTWPTGGPNQSKNSTEYGQSDSGSTGSAAFILTNHILLICLYRYTVHLQYEPDRNTPQTNY